MNLIVDPCPEFDSGLWFDIRSLYVQEALVRFMWICEYGQWYIICIHQLHEEIARSVTIMRSLLQYMDTLVIKWN